MNKQTKTLNNNKININFPKPTSFPTIEPYPTKVSNLAPTNKARKQATMRNTKPNSFSLTTINFTFGHCPYQNATKPSQKVVKYLPVSQKQLL